MRQLLELKMWRIKNDFGVRHCLCKITSSSFILWVRSSQRRNSLRINRFQQGSTGRTVGKKRKERKKGFWQETNENLSHSHCLPLDLSPPISLSISFVPPAVFSDSFTCLGFQPLIYDRVPCSSFSEIAWIRMSCCAIIRAWPQLSATRMFPNAAFISDPFQSLYTGWVFRLLKGTPITGHT